MAVRRSAAPPSAPERVVADPLDAFGPAVRDWFAASFPAPTRAQAEGWAAIAAGHHTLIHAPTGSGKTLAAFLWCLDRLVRDPSPPPTREQPGSRPRPVRLAAQGAVVRHRAQPPRAAGRDRPRGGPARRGRPDDLGRAADRRHDRRGAAGPRPPPAGHPDHHARVALPAPDEPGARVPARRRARHRRRDPRDRRDEARRAPGAQPRAPRARSGRPTRRRSSGSACRPPSVRSTRSPASSAASVPGREVRIVDAGARKPLELSVVVPVEDMGRLGEPLPLEEQPGGPAAGPEARVSIWPAIHPRILELIRAHRSTIVFCNSRRLAERLAQRLNELAGEELVRAHHGSIAREQRVAIEEALKDGRLPAIVATSSLELGIDMGAVDLVIQVEIADVGRPRPAADRPGRPPGRRRRRAGSSSRSTAATCSRRRSSPSGCTPGRSRRRASRATRSTSSPSRSWR